MRKHGKTQALRILQMTENSGNTCVLWIQGFPISLPDAMVGLGSSEPCIASAKLLKNPTSKDNVGHLNDSLLAMDPIGYRLWPSGALVVQGVRLHGLCGPWLPACVGGHALVAKQKEGRV